jgi:hypothetical protein
MGLRGLLPLPSVNTVINLRILKLSGQFWNYNPLKDCNNEGKVSEFEWARYFNFLNSASFRRDKKSEVEIFIVSYQ